MTESEIIEKMKALSIEQRIRLIEAIWRTISSEMHSTVFSTTVVDYPPLRGKVIRYDDPYEPVAAEDWEVLA